MRRIEKDAQFNTQTNAEIIRHMTDRGGGDYEK